MFMMKILFIKLLLVHYATQSHTDIQKNCDDNVSLECKDDDNKNRDYIAVAWYKINEQGKKKGLIRKNTDSTQRYPFNRNVTFGEKYSLVLENVKPEDSGMYICSISAAVGGQNLNPTVNLTVHACKPQGTPTTTLPLNTSQHDSKSSCHEQDLPVLWSITGYAALGLTKIVLSLICISVIRCLRLRSSRRNRRKW